MLIFPTILFIVIYSTSYMDLTLSQGSACSGVITKGADPTANSDKMENNTGISYLATDPSFTIGCCGVVTKWDVSIQEQGTLKLQIWRPGGSQYKLIGENSFSFNSPSQLIVQNIGVSPGQQITVFENDVIGWYTSSTEMVPFNSSTGSASGNLALTFGTSPTVGTSQNWASASFYGQRSYALQATIETNVAPSFTNLPVTQTHSDGTPATTFFTVTATDSNQGDISTLALTLLTHTDKFELSTQTIQRKAGWTWAVGTYAIDIKVTDQCANTATSTLTVIIENSAPVIASLSAVDLSEDTTAETKLADLSVTDTHSYSCANNGVTPTSGSSKFIMKQAPGSTTYSIYSAGNAGFSYKDVNQYIVNVTCTDVYGLTSWTELTVNLKENKPPTQDKLPATKAISAKTTVSGTEVFDASATDTDSTQLFYNKTCSPTPCPFDVYSNGKVKATENLNLHKIGTYDIFIYAYDGNTLVGPETLTININDINNIPVLTNLPATETVPENSAIGTNVFTIKVTDLDTTDTHTYKATYQPPLGDAYFSIDTSTGAVSVKDNINYETLKSLNKLTYVVTVTANDGREDSTAKQLTLTITDVNEQQTGFTKNPYSIAADEGEEAKLPKVLANPFSGTPVLDPDTTDIQTFTMDCGANQGKFRMNSQTGEVTQSSQYDLDAAGKEQEVVTCTVTATDQGSHVVTTKLEITIDEINDNPPVLDKENYSVFVPQCTGVGSLVQRTTATDKDIKQQHKDIKYTLTGSGFVVGSNGGIYVGQDLCNVPVGTQYDLTLTAENPDGLQKDTAPVTITIINPTTTTSTTTTTTAPSGSANFGNFLDNPENMAWFIPAMLLLVMMLALLVYMIYRCCRNPDAVSRLCKDTFDCCKKRKTTPNRKVREPEKIDGKYEWNVWSHSDYSNAKIEMR